MQSGDFLDGCAELCCALPAGRRCNIAVGTPGRVCRLLEIGALVPKHIRTLVLDEADHLMSDSFIRDIRCIAARSCSCAAVSFLLSGATGAQASHYVICRYIAQDVLPARKQVLALSATYPPALLVGLWTSAHMHLVHLCQGPHGCA